MALKSGREMRKTNATFGVLDNNDQAELQKLITKYGKQQKKISGIRPTPSRMFDEFIRLIYEYNIRLEEKDLDILKSLIKRNGCKIDEYSFATCQRIFRRECSPVQQSRKYCLCPIT